MRIRICNVRLVGELTATQSELSRELKRLQTTVGEEGELDATLFDIQA